jgi:hypothetical protein
MKVVVLDEIMERDAKCFLCKVDLAVYVQNIPSNFKDYEIQRGIVKNPYLEGILDTLLKKNHIPSITLVAENQPEVKDGELILSDYQVLDGLQRTYRLYLIYRCLDHIIQHKLESDFNQYWNENRYFFVDEINAPRQLVRRLTELPKSDREHSEEIFSGITLWLEIWHGLNKEDQIQKMLLLNAGQKSMSIKHQLELLFSFALKELQRPGIEVVTEKEMSSIQYSKSRTIHQYHFSHIVSALISLDAGKLVNTNADFVSSIHRDETAEINFANAFRTVTIELTIDFLVELDQKLSERYDDLGVKWLGREVVLVGIFGAIGAAIFGGPTNGSDAGAEVFGEQLQGHFQTLIQHVGSLNLGEFEKCRNAVSLNKVNIGNVNKKAVFSAVQDILKESELMSWKHYFGETQ